MAELDALVKMEGTSDGIRISVDDETKKEANRFIQLIEKRFAKVLGCGANQFGIMLAITDKYERTGFRTSDCIYYQGLGYCWQYSKTWKSQKVFNEWLFDALESQGFVKKDNASVS